MKLNITLTVTRILELLLTSSRRSPSVSAVTACFDAPYMYNIAELWGKPWPEILKHNKNCLLLETCCPHSFGEIIIFSN